MCLGVQSEVDIVVCAFEGLMVVTECLRSVVHDYEYVIHISNPVGRYVVYLIQWYVGSQCSGPKAAVLL
jgi:hypothetical protein